MVEIIEPETLRQLHPKASEEDIQKMLALETIKTSNAVFEDYHVFEKAVLALNKQPLDFRRSEGCLVSWIWYAITKIRELRPQMDFSHEVKQYVKYQSESQGVFIYPPKLNIPAVVDEEEVKERAGQPEQLTDDTVLDVQAAKYWAIREYLKEKSD